MLVDKTNYKNNVNFGAIYVQKNHYTKNQAAVINQIRDVLEKPLKKYNNLSANSFYSKKGIDFYMESSNKYEDFIYLAGYKGVKQLGTGVDEAITYSDSFSIGTYGEKYPFKIDDIEIGIKEKNNQSKMFLLPAGAVIIAAFVGILLATLGIHNKGKSKDITKPLIENINNTSNKAIMQDTVKLVRNFK